MVKKSKFCFFVLFIFLFVFALGCAQIQERRSQFGEGTATEKNETETAAGTLPTVPVAGKSSAAANTAEKKVAVILGPGGYKTFAHVGVLKELKKKNIPIQKVVGLEWGALVAGIYAQRAQVNEVEWKLYKLEKLDLDSSSFFGRKKDLKSSQVLTSLLKENLDAPEVSQLSTGFLCPALSLGQGALQWQDKGPMAKAVANCISYPPLFLSENNMVAGLFSLEDVIVRLKHEGFGIIILINVLGDGNLFDNPGAKEDYASAILWSEVRRQMWRAKSLATDFIDVNTRGIDFSAFESRKLLVSAGEAAGEKSANKLESKYGF